MLAVITQVKRPDESDCAAIFGSVCLENDENLDRYVGNGPYGTNSLASLKVFNTLKFWEASSTANLSAWRFSGVSISQRR